MTALTLDGGAGQDAVIFLSCDIVVVKHGIIAELCDAVKALRPEIPVDSIIMNATHTHSSLDTAENDVVSPDGKFVYPNTKVRAFFVQRCAEAVVESWDSRAEGATYLATKRSQENKGYGTSLYCNWIGYEGGQEWVEGVLENLNELKKETET